MATSASGDVRVAPDGSRNSGGGGGDGGLPGSGGSSAGAAITAAAATVGGHQPRPGRRRGPRPDVVSYSTAIMACSRAGNWERALGLLQEMRSDGLAPNSTTFTAAMAACRQNGAQAGIVTTLLDSIKSCGVSPDAILYGTALDACADAALCERARGLVAEMVAAGVGVDARARGAVAAACSGSTSAMHANDDH